MEDTHKNLHGADRSALTHSVVSAQPANTAAIAAIIAGHCQAGDVLSLDGELGAGKTTFAKAFAAALGVSETVTSPTFALVQSYETDHLSFHHIDAYRISNADEAEDLALAELIDSNAVTLVEWGTKIQPVLPKDLLHIAFEYAANNNEAMLHSSTDQSSQDMRPMVSAEAHLGEPHLGGAHLGEPEAAAGSQESAQNTRKLAISAFGTAWAKRFSKLCSEIDGACAAEVQNTTNDSNIKEVSDTSTGALTC